MRNRAEKKLYILRDGRRDSAVDIATSYGLSGRVVGVRLPVGSRFPLLQTGFRAHAASYPMGNGGSFSGGKTAGERSWPLIYK
jgi:hypothetical protein